MSFLRYCAAGAILALAAAPCFAVSSIQLDFDGGAGGAADTGFQGVYNLDPAGYALADGKLSIQTMPGDIFGRYDEDPDDAKNVFYSPIDADPNGGTVVEATVVYTNLNANFHGGGIWMGMDEDHYIRLGVINNSFEGGVVVEALRENEDLWGDRGGPGNDIEGHNSPAIATSPLAAPLTVHLRLVREGSTAKAYYSVDGTTYNWVANKTFDAIATGPSPTVEAPVSFKVGVYAFGGGSPQATAAFDSFSATATRATGFSASLAGGAVTNNDANHNGKVDEGETFTATIPMAAYLAQNAPPLLDKDLSRYSVTLSGSAASVIGTDVTYTGNFTITYTGPDLTANIEAGTFNIRADYSKGDGSARLSGTLTANSGAESSVPPFDNTDYAPFNPATFAGYYAPNAGDPAHGTMRGSLQAGSLDQPIVSRKLGAAIEGSPTTARDDNGNPRLIVASGQRIYVLDPATGDDAPGWEGGRGLDGRVLGRPAVVGRHVVAATDTGYVFLFNLNNGNMDNNARPGKAGSRIVTAPALYDQAGTGFPGAIYIVVDHARGTNDTAIMRISPNNLGLPSMERTLSTDTISTSSPAISPDGRIFVGTNKGLFVLDQSLVPLNSTHETTATPTSPLVVGSRVFVGTGDGSVLKTLNASNGNELASQPLGSPLQFSAFYERQSGYVEAGVADGRILAFQPDGTAAGFTLPGLFSPENTGGSLSMPVVVNDLLYRATEKRQILSGTPLDEDNEQTVDLISAVHGAMAATGPKPGVDFIAGTSPDGYVHLIGVR